LEHKWIVRHQSDRCQARNDRCPSGFPGKNVTEQGERFWHLARHEQDRGTPKLEFRDVRLNFKRFPEQVHGLIITLCEGQFVTLIK
jgi:hypothetical protein